MPNHVHFIWRINSLNGRETAHGSFLNYTAHEFKRLTREDPEKLEKYAVNARNKQYEFWIKDPPAIHLHSRVVMQQKLNCIHLNPLSGSWLLAPDPCSYKYSSASYYGCNEKNFDFLVDVREEF